MTYVVTEVCIGVEGEACVEVCQALCIVSKPIDPMSYINPARGTDCGACMHACVVNTLYPEQYVPRASVEFININGVWLRRKLSVRKCVRKIAAEAGQWLS